MYIARNLNVGINVGINLSKTERLVLDCIKQDKAISAEAIAIKIGVTERTVARALKKLREEQIIERIGSNKTGYWEIIK